MPGSCVAGRGIGRAGLTAGFRSQKLVPMALRIFLTALVCAGILPAADVKAPTDSKALTGNYNIPLWEAGKVPLAKGDAPLDNPFLTVFVPKGKRNSGSVVIAPGGSNIMLMYGQEGIDIAERYNDWGVTAFVLTYRLSPRYGEDARVADGKRAMQVVRAHAAEMKLDPAKVGFIGFSAGGNMARPLVNAAGGGDANATDPVERMSARPDYLALVYGPGRATPGEVLKNYPPVFLLAAAGDTGPALGSAQFFMDLTRAGATAEIHVYQKGHHGFGDGYASGTFSDWMGRLEHFLKQGNFIPGGKE
jgi:acetyl esterase/lipase